MDHKEEDFSTLDLADDAELELDDVNIFDDALLKDFFSPWPSSSLDKMIDHTCTDVASFDKVKAISEEFPSSNPARSTNENNMLGIQEMEVLENSFPVNVQAFKQETQESELKRLLTRPSHVGVKQELSQVKFLLKDNEKTSQIMATTTPSQPVSIMPALTSQPQKILISPQTLPSTLKICPIFSKPVEEKQPTMFSTVTTHKPSIQEISPSKQLTVPQTQIPVVLNSSPTPSMMPHQFQLVFEQQPMSSNVVVSAGGPSTCAAVMPVALPPKIEKRAHNAIEKKYRTSINDKIKDLKNLLFGTDAKIQKSGVLKKAIDHIKQLRTINHRLSQENTSFKLKLQQLGKLKPVKEYEKDVVNEVLCNPLTPESLSDIKSSSSPISSPEDFTQDENFPMFDRTRLVMCIVMMSFFVFDPFHLIFSWQPGIFSSSTVGVNNIEHHGRLLMSVDSFDISQTSKLSMVISLIAFLFRTIAIMFIFFKLFVFGEPSWRPDSNSAANFRFYKKQGNLAILKGEYVEGSKILVRCLEISGRPLPTSRLDMTCSLLWNIFRQIVHRFSFLRWLSTLQKCSSFVENDLKYRQESAKQAALVYHQLHQLYLSGLVPVSECLSTVVSLNAVNTADIATKCLSEEDRVEIFIDCAIQLRSTLPRNLQFLARYFLVRARKLCRGQSLTLPYSCWWLFTPIGHRFFVSNHWSCKMESNMWNAANPSYKKPLERLTHKFCEFLLEQALSSLMLSKDSNEYHTDSLNSEGSRALDLLHTMTECVQNSRKSRSEGTARNVKVFDEVVAWRSRDHIGCWWAAVGKVATYWLIGDINNAQQQYKIIERIPEEIKNNDDPLGKALLMSFMAKSRISDRNIDEILDYCDEGSALLKESLAYSSLFPQSKLLKLMHLLCCDWLLSTRADLWERTKLNDHKVDRVEGFYKDLKSLQKIASYLPDVMNKVCIYQATYRIMMGANPMKTKRLLQKGIQDGRTDIDKNISKYSVSAKKDRAVALALASGHLPTSLFCNNAERENMMVQAVDCFQKFGEKAKIARCRKIITSF